MKIFKQTDKEGEFFLQFSYKHMKKVWSVDVELDLN